MLRRRAQHAVSVRRETGKESSVRVHCSEGVATHTGPESCVDDPRGRGEALTGDRTGQPLSRGAPGDRQGVGGESPLR